MKLFDSVYGEYELPLELKALIDTPAVQRLRWVALSNIPSLSYPMISGVSRYAHSLGVSHLANLVSDKLGLSHSDKVNLICSGLLHDAGMPPLGHITEEALTILDVNYDHEESLKLILLEEGRRFHQMPDGEKVGITEALAKLHADSNKIFQTILGKGDLGKIISSDMDVDNIDNVIRLFRLIFPSEKGYSPESIAKNYFSHADSGEKSQKDWESAREKLYTKLMFSIEDFGQKATIKRLIKTFFEMELETKSQQEVLDGMRFKNDYQFLNDILLKLNGTPHECEFFSGKFDRVVAYGWIDSINKKHLHKARKELEEGFYYLDFIPDKRFKKKAPSENRGALIGIFSFGKSTKADDVNIRKKAKVIFPELQENHTPIDQLESDQLSLL